MARKNVLPYKVATTQSLAANFTSSPTLIKYLDNCSYQINVTTTDSTGTFSIEGSDDYSINEGNDNTVINPGNWAALPLSGTPTVGAANDTILINLNQLPFNAIRVKYNSTVAGTGTCDIYLIAKQLGG